MATFTHPRFRVLGLCGAKQTEAVDMVKVCWRLPSSFFFFFGVFVCFKLKALRRKKSVVR
jgi:hypothetical protein